MAFSGRNFRCGLALTGRRVGKWLRRRGEIFAGTIRNRPRAAAPGSLATVAIIQREIIKPRKSPMTPSPRPVNFPSSARRHLDDAKLLEANRRLPNAGHLYGYVAECGLKALLIWHGHPTDAEGSPRRDSGYRVHVDQLVIAATFESLRLLVSGRSGARYLAMIPTIRAFSDWRVHHRYFSEAALPASLPQWKVAAHEVARMLDQARLDGRK
jgi:hypothetical protein